MQKNLMTFHNFVNQYQKIDGSLASEISKPSKDNIRIDKKLQINN